MTCLLFQVMSINCSLWQDNSMSVKHFAFTTNSLRPLEQCWLLFSLILLMLLASLTGNALIAPVPFDQSSPPYPYVLLPGQLVFLGDWIHLLCHTQDAAEPYEIGPRNLLGRAVLYRCFLCLILGSVNAIFWQPWLLIAILAICSPITHATRMSHGVCPFSNGFLGSGLHSKLGAKPTIFFFGLLWPL